MDLLDAILCIRDMISEFFGVLDRIVFNIGPSQVSLLQMIFVALVTGFVISVFWKGART